MKNLCYTIYQQNDGFIYLAAVEFAYKEFIASLPKVASKNWQLGEATSYQKYLPACQKLIRGICQLVLDSRGRLPSG